MVRAIYVLIWAALILTPALQATSSEGLCSNAETIAGICKIDAQVDADHVTLSGSSTSGGNSGGGGRSSSTSNNGGTGHGSVKQTAPRPGDRCASTMQMDCGLDFSTVPTARASAAPAARPLTIRDLAAFRPSPGRQQMEPNGWVVAGLDANFFAIVDQQLVPGTLLSQPATVRFTPVGYHWSYGDGTAAVRSTKGGTWASLGLVDFDATPTSHVYETAGDYVIRLSIDFRAEYQLGSSAFVAVTGLITLPANDLRVTVTGAKTVLVDHDCVADPSGPGC